MEKERYLAACHESAHVVINAAKGRRIETVTISSLDEQNYGGMTCVRCFSDSGTEPGDIMGVVGKDPFAPLFRATARTAAQQAAIELPLEDELAILAAGIVGERIAAADHGWQLDPNHENVQAEADITQAKEFAQRAEKLEAFASLWQEAQSEAAHLFQRADIREAWKNVTEALFVRQMIKWKDMSDQMMTLLTQLSGRDQLI
jgi:hypothetical protein